MSRGQVEPDRTWTRRWIQGACTEVVQGSGQGSYRIRQGATQERVEGYPGGAWVAAWATRQPEMGWGGREGGLGRWGMQDTGVCTGVLQGVEAGEGIFECNRGLGRWSGR